MNRHVAPVVIGLITAAAMILFAFYQHVEGHVVIPTIAFYFAAGVIVLAPSVWGALRHKRCKTAS